MKKPILIALLSTIIIITAGCQSQQNQEPIIPEPPVDDEVQVQEEIAPTTPSTDEITYKDFPRSGTLFRGFYFDIKYPREFIVKPTEPTTDYNNKTYVQTDEAYFSSPDGTVEFFVYSPLWSGDPENYLTIAPTEEIVSEETETGPALPNQLRDSERVIRWVTIKAKDESYYRSFVSIKEQVSADDTGSELHHVFGIKYKDSETYEKYKDTYAAFKDTLEQYAD